MKHTDTFINSCVDACKVASVVSNSLRPYGLYVASQAPFSVGFPRQEYWSGLPRPPSGDLPNPGIEPMSPESPALQVDSLLLSHQGSTYIHMKHTIYIT